MSSRQTMPVLNKIYVLKYRIWYSIVYFLEGNSSQIIYCLGDNHELCNERTGGKTKTNRYKRTNPSRKTRTSIIKIPSSRELHYSCIFMKTGIKTVYNIQIIDTTCDEGLYSPLRKDQHLNPDLPRLQLHHQYAF